MNVQMELAVIRTIDRIEERVKAGQSYHCPTPTVYRCGFVSKKPITLAKETRHDRIKPSARRD